MTQIHITETEWGRFWHHELSTEAEAALLSHVCTCEYCAEQMALGMEAAGLIQTKKWQTQATLHHVRKQAPLLCFLRSIRFQLISYSVKVSLAMAVLLFLLFHPRTSEYLFPSDTTLASEVEAEIITEDRFPLADLLHSGTRFINQTLQDFSYQLINKEDLHNAK